MAEQKPGSKGQGRADGPQGARLPSQPSSPPMGGYNCRILRVDLSAMRLVDEPLTYELARKYIGGAGLVAYFLWNELKAGIDPLGPENKLIFALGPVTGLTLPGASRYCAGAKSPMTGGIAKSEAGGFWMAELKRAGYDAIIVEGKAERPIYLWINDGRAVLKDAGHLWGKENKEVQEAITTELGDKHIRVASIGPAGERMVRYACIMTGLVDACGRGGLGAVMGSKNLKAIAVRGRNLPVIADAEYIKSLRSTLLANKHPLSEYGTGGPEMIMHEQDGDLPVHNQRDGLFPTVGQITGVAIKESIRVKMDGCFACNVRCKKVVRFEEPYPCDEDYGGPEYETLGALGSNCGIDNLKAICKGNERCNALGLDTISTGSALAFAMECYEKGLITKAHTGGLELKFGDENLMLQGIELIARREGVGDFLADGAARMAKKIGQGSEKFAMAVKGLDAAMHDARAMLKFRIGYMLHPQGADHCASIGPGNTPMGLSQLNQFGILEPVKEDFGPKRMSLFKLQQCFSAITDSMVLCLMPSIDAEQKLGLLRAVTGWNTGWIELIQIAERIITTMRLFNMREGFTADDDELPDRYYERKTDGILATKDAPDRATMRRARQLYYFYMGWDSNGVPRPEKLWELEIEAPSAISDSLQKPPWP
jgi:aldehyde:ferredoxin oxidoreductase